MKRLALIIAAASFFACNSTKEEAPPSRLASVVPPGQEYNLASAMSQALSCPVDQLSWFIQESLNPGFQSPRDGAITQTGLFTAPSCGSVYVGSTLHVQATGCGKTGTVEVAIAQEVLSAVNVAYAILFPGTAQECLAPDATRITVPIGSTVQFYGEMVFTCQKIVTPTPPSVWPPVCQ